MRGHGRGKPVAAYATIARVLDACVLSLGLLGVTVFGAGLVLVHTGCRNLWGKRL